MSMNRAVRQQGDVTVLDHSGRISLGEALAFGMDIASRIRRSASRAA